MSSSGRPRATRPGRTEVGELQTREARAGDLESVLGLLRQMPGATGLWEASADARDVLEDMLARPAFYMNRVACREEDGRVIGFVSVVFYKSLLHKGGSALINELVVDAAQRGRGVGRTLLDEAIAEARTRGMDEIEVSTFFGNDAAIRLYRSAGFTEEYLMLGMELDGTEQ